MAYYEVLIADSKYRSDQPLTYRSANILPALSFVSVPLRGRIVNGFILKKVGRPAFPTLFIKSFHDTILPKHCVELARWVSTYYQTSFGETMRQFAPSGTAPRRSSLAADLDIDGDISLAIDAKLTSDQSRALRQIRKSAATTILLHGDTGTGKTRVYLELASDSLKSGRSVILLTPEIALTHQLTIAVQRYLNAPVFVLHSQLTSARRKKTWLAIARAKEPVVIIGARSALFSPVQNLGLIVLDEAHEPAYKQDQSPRYHAIRVASQLAKLVGCRAILGTATPNLVDYFLADQHQAIVRMRQIAASANHRVAAQQLIDLRDAGNLSSLPYISKQLLSSIKTTLANGKQVMVYLNRRGSARLILCTSCGWRMVCPNCDLPVVYHGDEHRVRCHSCGYAAKPPVICPECKATDIVFRSAGTKSIADSLARAFPNYRLQRFDSDNLHSEGIHTLHRELKSGQVDIMVGTQLLAKGLDLPKLGLVGVINADTSLSLPDFTSGERTFQLLYQVTGRVGRGHGKSQVVVQSYNPKDPTILAALNRDWQKFYDTTLTERKDYRFPPYVHLLKLTCRRSSSTSAERASRRLKHKILKMRLPIDLTGPTPCFWSKRGNSYYWQIVVKARQRSNLAILAALAGSGWSADLDPTDLL